MSRRVATCKPGKPGLTRFSETLALFFIQFLSFRKMKVQDRQNGPSGLPEKTGWLRARCQCDYISVTSNGITFFELCDTIFSLVENNLIRTAMKFKLTQGQRTLSEICIQFNSFNYKNYIMYTLFFFVEQTLKSTN